MSLNHVAVAICETGRATDGNRTLISLSVQSQRLARNCIEAHRHFDRERAMPPTLSSVMSTVGAGRMLFFVELRSALECATRERIHADRADGGAQRARSAHVDDRAIVPRCRPAEPTRACGPQCARISWTSSGVSATSGVDFVARLCVRPANGGTAHGLGLDQHQVLGREFTTSHLTRPRVVVMEPLWA
jgi:hypothetical protein